ncbi:MAG: S9 family peptidase [Gemmatimonadaceae bacterium]|nr:S9 family peptidase [Gemmatimonadaceae bacterium]
MRLLSGSLTVLALCSAPSFVVAQSAATSSKKPLTVGDYALWRTIEGASISADGRWVAYNTRLTNTLPVESKPVLRLRDVENGKDVEILHASQPTFSPDGKWVAYLVEPPAPARGARADSTGTAGTAGAGGAGAAPAAASPSGATPPGTAPSQPQTPARGTPPRRWELRELATGTVRSWQDIQSVTFSPTSSHLLLRRRAAGPTPAGGATGGAPGAGGAAGAANAARATDALLHELANGRTTFLGSVADAAFNKTGAMLAYTVDATVRDGNGLFVIDLATNATRVVDNDSLRYSRLAWNDRGTGLAVLKGREVERMRERDNRLLVVPDLSQTRSAMLDSKAVTPGFMISERAPLSFSDDGARVFFGLIPQSPAPDTARRRSTDSIADVDIWRTADERIQSAQMIQIEQDRNRTFRQAFDVAASRFVALSDSTMRDLEVAINGPWAVGRDGRAYRSDYETPAADFYRVDTRTGQRTPMMRKQFTGRHVAGLTPDGRYYLYWKNAQWQAWDIAAGSSRAIGANAPSFVDMQEDHPGPRPPYGIAGFSSDSAAVIVNHRFDQWVLPLDGGVARNLTNGQGSRDQVVYRWVRMTPLDSSALRGARVAREVDLSKPVMFSLFGEFTKKAGFARLANGSITQLVYADASFNTPMRATNADSYLFTRQSYSEFPDLLIADASLANPRKLSDVNPQQAQYQWGRRVLFDYVTKRGDKLQGMITLPEDYKTGERRPTLVTFYEKNSQGLNRYPMPSYITGMGGIPAEATSRGYVTMVPDVAFHTGSSHSDMLDAVEAATKKMIALGYADPKRIGVHGHSYGGEGAAFIGTRSKMFAAVGMGAGVTDLFSDFSQSWGWTYQVQGGSGENGNSYYLSGQGRWGFSPWEKPEVYHYESALTHVPNVSAPFLIMHGTADPTVSFTEGMNFYNALRYNKKDATMLAYPGEGHGLRGLANRKDLTVRYFEFFDHHLKGTPAPKWMTDGVPFILKDRPAAAAPVIRP